MEASAVRYTLREISYALEKRWGRHVPSSPVVLVPYVSSFCSGIIGGVNKGIVKKRDDNNNNNHDEKEDKEDKEEREYRSVQKSVSNFKVRYGRRPRILVVKMGQDGHNCGSRVISSGLYDLGFDVNLRPALLHFVGGVR